VTVLTAPFEHVHRLTDGDGIIEHAREAEPRADCGYCLDDAARGLVVVSREPNPSDRVAELGATYLTFVRGAQASDGRFHNRRDVSGRWIDFPTVEDCWGRALWGLGTAAARSPRPETRERALRCFERSAGLRSPWRRAMAFAALGAGEVLVAHPDHRGARDLIASAVVALGPVSPGDAWPWPEARLTYANAAIPEALIVAGRSLADEALLADGLRLLDWLVETETHRGHLSVTPVGGWTLGEDRPGFDQQPIEVAALADACATALDVTADTRWARRVALAEAWFLGENDADTPLFDPETGGGCDGLEPAGRNRNQGAESTLAMVSTFQQALRLAESRRG
jgi:hypothetical protein